MNKYVYALVVLWGAFFWSLNIGMWGFAVSAGAILFDGGRSLVSVSVHRRASERSEAR